MIVIEELDNFKTSADERGKNARLVSRYLDQLRQKGKLGQGVKTEGGGMVKVEFPRENILSDSRLENPVDGGAWFRLLSMGLQRVGHD